jgi:predicted NBD/HSP70 family sugar kinase
MSIVSVPAIVMAGITFYVGLYHLLVYVRRTENRVNLTFALTCLAVGLYDVASAGLYQATNVTEGALWQRMQFIAAALLTAAFFWFAMDYLGQRPKRMLYTVSALCALAGIIQLVDRGELTWAVGRPFIRDVVLPFGTITYYEATQGPLSVLQSLMEMTALAYVLWSGVHSYRRERNQAALPLVVALSVFFVSVVNDIAVGVGLYRFVYTVEYAYMSLILLMTYMLSNAIEQALSTAQQREHELAEATRQAQQAAQTAQQAAQTAQQLREHEEKIARQLRQTVQEYVAFLERVTAGDYTAELNLDGSMAGEEESKELVALGHQLTAAVKSLVEALQSLETIQRRYVREAWTSFTSSTAHRGVQYRDATLKLAEDAWLAPMAQAVQAKSLTTRESELALPLTLRGQVIGAMGARWKEGKVWSQDDLALIEAVTNQLAQTIEGLRLLDETQRRAAQEQLTGAIAARIRETLDMDTILQTAARELEQAMSLHDVTIRLQLGGNHE